MDKQSVPIRTEVVDGDLYVRLDDISDAMSLRAQEYLQAAADLTPLETDRDRQFHTAYLAVANELEYRAEMMKFASIAYREEPR